MNLKNTKAEILYRGHKITAWREKCMAGYSLLYYTIVRESDGLFVADSYTTDESSPAEYVNMLTERVDAEIADTEGKEAETAIDKMLSGISPCCDAPLDESRVIKAGRLKGHGKRYCSSCGKFVYLV